MNPSDPEESLIGAMLALSIVGIITLLCLFGYTLWHSHTQSRFPKYVQLNQQGNSK